MKKISSFLVLAMIATTIHAQFGVKGGVNFSTWRGDNADGAATLVGYYGGVFYNYPISDMFSIQPELVYSSEGAKEEGGGDYKYITNYINFTPLVRYNSGGFFVGTGPQIGILTGAKWKYSGGSEDAKDDFKSTNFSWSLAVGYGLENGVGLYARYNLGLSSIADYSDTDVKTSVIQVGLRYSFSPDKK